MKEISFFLFFILSMTLKSYSQIYNSIREIEVFPDYPTSNDSLKIVIEGYQSSGSIKHDSINIEVQDSIIRLTFHCHLGIGTQMPFNWTKEKIIAPIPSENYKLIIYEQVDAFNKVLDSLEFEIIESSTSYFDYKFDSKIEMYPNPTSKYLTVVSKQLIDRIDIFDLTGRFILSTKELYIDFTAMENGQYIIKIHLSSGQEIGKIIFKNEY